MKNVLNFEEYNKKYDFNAALENPRFKNVNNIIKEMMGVSKEAIEISNEVVDFLNGEINNGNFTERTIKEKMPPHMHYNGIDENVYKIQTESIIYNHKFTFNVHLFNCSDIDDYSYNQLVINTLTMSIETFMEDGKSSYKLNASIFLRDFKLPRKTLNALVHECRHCLENINRYDNKEIDANLDNEYNILYNKATYYIINDIDGVSAGFKMVCKGIYKGDKTEISAFTQQDYDEVSKLKTKEEVSDYLFDCELSRALVCVDDAMFVLEYNLVVRQQVKALLGISGKKLLNVLRRRKKKLETSLAKMNVMYKDLMDESFIIRQDKSEFEIYKL